MNKGTTTSGRSRVPIFLCSETHAEARVGILSAEKLPAIFDETLSCTHSPEAGLRGGG